MTENVNYAERNAELIERLPSVVDELRPYFAKVARSQYSFCRDTAEDLSGETALDAYVYLTGNEFIESGNGLKGFVATAFKRNCMDELKKRSRGKRKGNEIPIESDIEDDKNVSSLDQLVGKEASEIIGREIEGLPDKQKQAILEHLYKRGSTYSSGVERARKSLKLKLYELGILEI